MQLLVLLSFACCTAFDASFVRLLSRNTPSTFPPSCFAGAENDISQVVDSELQWPPLVHLWPSDKLLNRACNPSLPVYVLWKIVHTAFILSRRAVTQLPLLHLWVGTTLHTKA